MSKVINFKMEVERRHKPNPTPSIQENCEKIAELAPIAQAEIKKITDDLIKFGEKMADIAAESARVARLNKLQLEAVERAYNELATVNPAHMEETIARIKAAYKEL